MRWLIVFATCGLVTLSIVILYIFSSMWIYEDAFQAFEPNRTIRLIETILISAFLVSGIVLYYWTIIKWIKNPKHRLANSRKKR